MAEDEKQAQPEATEEKPATRRRVRRTTKAEAETAAATATTETASAENAGAADAQGEEKPKRRRVRKAAADEAAEASTPAAESAAADAAEEKPKRRTRTRKVQITESEAAPEPAGKGADDASGKSGAVSEKASDSADSADDATGAGAGAGAGTRTRVQRNQQGRRDQQAQRNGNGSNHGNQQRNQRHQRRQRNNREVEPSVTREELAELKVADLRERAAALELDVTGMKKAELVEAVFDASVKAEGFLDVAGILDILSDGYGFLRTTGYLPGESDCYVGTSLIKRNGLRKGDYIEGTTRPGRENEKFAAIQKISRVNGLPLEEAARRPRFADLTPVYPSERLVMEHGKNTTTARVIDLVAPIGKGQRGLIVSPPKAGKTTILKDIAASISANNPEVHLMCLLVDERPEEVTDMQRSIKGEVISSTFDMPADNHIAVAEMVIERAKRMVEGGRDVVILLDSITRLARAYNLAQPASGRVLSGGVDSTALYPPKRCLGAARNIENGGSLTILASALIETGSKMDEVIFEEFKGTGNMELRLDRQLADRRIFPAIDPVASGTRKEELLLDTQMAPLIWAVRRLLANMNNTERAMDMLIKSIRQTDDNNEFLLRTARKAQHSKTETLEL